MSVEWFVQQNIPRGRAPGAWYVSVSSAKNGSDVRNVLMVGMSAKAMADMRLLIGDRVQLGLDSDDGGYLLLRRVLEGGVKVCFGGTSPKGASAKAQGTVSTATIRFGCSPFGLPPYEYRPFSRADVILDAGVLRIPLSDMVVRKAAEVHS